VNFAERVSYENAVLARDGMSQFQIYRNDNGSYYLWGHHRTSANNRYTLWSPIPTGYPRARPHLYIHDPNPLWGYAGSATINSYGVSHGMHTLGNGPHGEVQICHWRDERWHSGITLNKVMMKCMLWLEAYEQHVSTGKAIDEFVRTMQ